MGIAKDLILIVLAGLIGGLIARKFKQPLIIGYILAGIALGPYTGGATISQVGELENLAEIGVALLLFSLGLEFPMREIKPIWRIAFFGTLIQVVLTLVFGFFIGRFMGWERIPSWWFAIAIVSSSTSVTMKTLVSRRLMGTLSSRVMLGMSIIQDITVIPMLVVLVNVSSGTDVGFMGVVKPIATAMIFVAIMMVLGARLIPVLLRFVANWNSRELFLLTITAVGLGVGYITRSFNLSFSFGAFIAGIVLSRSEYVHKALSDLIPVRDIFGLLFFVSIGMLMNPSFLYANFWIILSLTLVVGIGRGVLLGGIGFAFKYRNIVPLAMVLGMIPISEISFIVARAGVESKGISNDVYSIILTTVVMSMILGPLIAGLTRPVYDTFKRLFKPEQVRTVNVETDKLDNHVVIVGGGHTARYIGFVLKSLELPYVIVENNHRIFQEFRQDGLNAIFGDAAEYHILSAASIQRAKLLLIATSGFGSVINILNTARELNADIRVLARAESREQVEQLGKNGVNEVVQPEFEAGLEMARQALLSLNVSAAGIQQHLDSVRREQYNPLEDIKDGSHNLSQLMTSINMIDLNWLEISGNNPLAGLSLKESNLRRDHGINVVGVIRNKKFEADPDAEFRIEAGDFLALIGKPEKLREFKAFVSSKNVRVEPA
ncbi:cation:proton antiporter [Lentisphaerota bacterium ZTH]|nr:cation:proton antiporter [Lentisphaerota bacterium]WET07213.1 cation:proton antiporter [Lentisphaerota bacterium ZTH]